MLFTKAICAFIGVGIFAACQTSTGNSFSEKKLVAKNIPKERAGEDGSLQIDTALFTKHMQQLKQRAKQYNYSNRFSIMIDLGMHSGSMRCFFVNLSDEKLLKAGLVTHGSSVKSLQPGERQYSNVNGSLCSSPGVYKIGAGYQGSFGLAYKLHGLDSSNSNAYSRAVVLHAHSCVPDTETSSPICQSWGCPTISPAFLEFLRPYIDNSARPMLLDIYDNR